MTSTNFLPAFKSVETPTGKRNTLQCKKRDRAVPATPEEKVRQRILHWLMEVKKWPKDKIKLERSHDWVGDPNRHRIRPDIELLDADGATLVVVECKALGIPLGGPVEQQAMEYAIKTKSQHIWISNGDQHKFFVRPPKSTWKTTKDLKPLQVSHEPPAVNFDFPDTNDEKAIDRYFKRSFPVRQRYENLDENDRSIVLSVHKLLFNMEKTLSFSFKGVHVLEDRGADIHEFSTAGGKWRNLYGDFIAATSGRVEAMSVGVCTWDGKGSGIRLCVGVRKPSRKHHALQMDLADAAWNEGHECWEIFHSGRMAGVSNETVFKAVEESGAGDWLERETGYIYLGDLYWAEKATWENSKELLANLLHYGIIRTNLRDAIKARRR